MTFNHGVRSSTLRWVTKKPALHFGSAGFLSIPLCEEYKERKRRMMKRFVFLFCSVLLVLGCLTGCGKKEDQRTEYPTYVTAEPRVQTPDPELDPTDYKSETEAIFAGILPQSEENFTYSVENETAMLTGYTGTDTNVRVPETLGGFPVTAVAETAFSGRNDLTVLALPATAKQLAKGVFADCTGLTALQTTFPEAGYIGWLFGAAAAEQNNVPALRNIGNLEIVGSVTALPEKAFYGCGNLEAILLPESLQTLGAYAFCYCEGLKYINADRLVTVGEHALDGCLSLQTLTFGSSLSSLGFAALYDCSGLMNLSVPFAGDGGEHPYMGYVFGATEVDFSKGFYPERLRKITVSAPCTVLGNFAFYECSSLYEIILPEGLKTIGIRAFSGCVSLREVTLPRSLDRIGESAFSGCKTLSKIVFSGETGTVGINAFLGCDALTEATVPAGIVIGEGNEPLKRCLSN